MQNHVMGVLHPSVWIAPIAEKAIRKVLPDVELLTLCDESVEWEFMRAGHPTPNTYYRLCTYFKFLEEAGAEAILFGCSTMNRAVDYARPLVNVPIQQIDEPMMRKAVSIGRRIGLIGTVATTMPASRDLLVRAAESAGKQISIVERLRGDAFAIIHKGDVQAYVDILLSEIDHLAPDVDVIVMAQVSMSVLDDVDFSPAVPVLTSGRLGAERMKEILLARVSEAERDGGTSD